MIARCSGTFSRKRLPPGRHVDLISHIHQCLVTALKHRLDVFRLAQGIEGFGAGAVDVPGVTHPRPTVFFQVIPGFVDHLRGLRLTGLAYGAGSQAGSRFAGQGGQTLAQASSRASLKRLAAPVASPIASRTFPRLTNAKTFPRASWVGEISCRACSVHLAGVAQVAGSQINLPQVHQVIGQQTAGAQRFGNLRACSISGRACLYNPIVNSLRPGSPGRPLPGCGCPGGDPARSARFAADYTWQSRPIRCTKKPPGKGHMPARFHHPGYGRCAGLFRFSLQRWPYCPVISLRAQ